MEGGNVSEYTQKVVVCDMCYPDFLPGFTFFPLESVRGVFRGKIEDAEGWEERDFGHICPDCIEAEQDDGGEVVMGGAALAPLFSKMGEGDEESSNAGE